MGIALAVIGIAFCGKCNIAYAENGEMQPEDYEAIMRLQENAVIVNDLLNEAFGYDEIGNVNYPEEYAGSWIDGDTLVVALTNMDDNVITKYLGYAEEYSGYISFTEAEYSYNHLSEAAETIATKLIEDGNNAVVSYSVSELDNNVVIGIDASVPSTVSYEDIEKITDVPVVFKEDVPVQETILQLEAGKGLINREHDWGMTLSCSGTYCGQPVIVTCGHGNTVGDRILNEFSTPIGKVVFKRDENNNYGDFSFVDFDTKGYYFGNLLVDGRKITGSISDPAVNTVLKFRGQMTGYDGYGTVKQREVTTQIKNSTKKIKGLTRLQITYGNAQEGDSGAPFFQESSNGLKYCGAMMGGKEVDGIFNVYFTPYKYMEAAGFTVKVY